MTLREIDATVRQNALQMLGSDALNCRYVTALNMLAEQAKASSPGFRRWMPEEVKAGKQRRVEAL